LLFWSVIDVEKSFITLAPGRENPSGIGEGDFDRNGLVSGVFEEIPESRNIG
jgi:hypothetical protein